MSSVVQILSPQAEGLQARWRELVNLRHNLADKELELSTENAQLYLFERCYQNAVRSPSMTTAQLNIISDDVPQWTRHLCRLSGSHPLVPLFRQTRPFAYHRHPAKTQALPKSIKLLLIFAIKTVLKGE